MFEESWFWWSNWEQITYNILAEFWISLIFGEAMGYQLLIIVTLTDNLVVFATLAESFFSTNYRLENMKETQWTHRAMTLIHKKR